MNFGLNDTITDRPLPEEPKNLFMSQNNRN